MNNIFLNFTNIYGDNVGKLINSDRLRNISNEPVSFACLRSDGLGVEPNEPDLYVFPDMDHSANIKINEGIVDWIPCFLMKGETKHQFCPRTILYNAVRKLEKEGIQVSIGFEPEFYLLRKDLSPLIENEPIIPAFNITGTLSAYSFLNELEQSLAVSGIRATSVVHEGGKSQFEFSLVQSEPINAVDQLVRFKTITKLLAYKHGLIASFMPKPFNDDFGSATQINYSIQQNSIEEVDLYSIAGILKHAKAISAFTCPTTNSYKRLFSKSSKIDVLWSPSIIGFGYDNRSTLVRFVSKDKRIEYRASDYSGNMYLSVAALLYAVYDGIYNSLRCPRPIKENCFNETITNKKIEYLPISELKKDCYIVENMGTDFCNDYILNKKKEWIDDYLVVSDEERGKYIDL